MTGSRSHWRCQGADYHLAKAPSFISRLAVPESEDNNKSDEGENVRKPGTRCRLSGKTERLRAHQAFGTSPDFPFNIVSYYSLLIVSSVWCSCSRLVENSTWHLVPLCVAHVCSLDFLMHGIKWAL